MSVQALMLLTLLSTPTLECPWPCGVTYMCTQGHGGFSHNGGSYYAWDFGLYEGAQVVAAAPGSVSHVRMSGSTGCCDPSCGWDANYVAVDHGDGSTALYLHLQQWSSGLSVGDWVNPGDAVGRVGLTGYVCGAHLHFQVQSTCGSYYCTSVPGEFYDYGDPGYGDWLTSGNCGVPDDDGDGWSNDDDCDDGNPSVHPGATEICDDGLDNDCSGGDLASTLHYQDGDGDGYGDGEVWVCGTPGAGLVAVGGDCDDGDPGIHPGAGELCDAVDNNCDGEVDEGDPQQMGDPPPPFAARLTDASFPASLAPGEAAPVWAAFENVGDQTWPAGEVWLASLVAAEGEPSPLFDEETWAAWDVLTRNEEDTPPGGIALFEGQIRLDAGADGAAADAFQLVTAGGDWAPCPGPDLELTVDPDVGANRPDAHDPDPSAEAGGCRCGPPDDRIPSPSALLIGLLAIAFLSRRELPGHAGARSWWPRP